MAAISFRVNGKKHKLDVDPSTPLLWVLRDHLKLPGTKFSCGIGQCGACTVHLNGEAVRSCQVQVKDVAGANVVTVEGLSQKGDHVLQQLWAEMNVPQCGYCQAGMLMAASALLKKVKQPTDKDIDDHVSNACRCGTYQRVRAAIHQAAEITKS